MEKMVYVNIKVQDLIGPEFLMMDLVIGGLKSTTQGLRI